MTEPPAIAIELEPRDPLIFRDARPFSADPGALAQSLPFPLPSTIAGAVRTHLIASAPDFRGWSGTGEPARALNIRIQGPILAKRATDPERSHTAFYPAPHDALIVETDDATSQAPRLNIAALRPLETPPTGSGTNIPTGLVPLAVTDERKPFTEYAFWSQREIVKWLYALHPAADDVPLPQNTHVKIPTETRVHVAIDAQRGTHKEGALFGTVALAFPRSFSLLVRASPPADDERDTLRALEQLIPLGGERRLATIREVQGAWPACDIPKQPELAKAHGIRLLLVTPALFENGWMPKSAMPQGDGGALLGAIPGLASGPTAQLVSVASGRRIPVSGWDLKARSAKPIRYAMPAGSVLFFKIAEGDLDRTLLERLWLHSICDDAQDNDNGFGLVLPGIW